MEESLRNIYADSLPIILYWIEFQGASLSKGLPSGPTQKIYPMIHSIDARFLNATIQDA